MRQRVALHFGAVILAAALGPIAVSAEPSDWTMRLALVSITPDGTFETVRGNGKRVTTEMSGGVGVSAELERRLGPRWGIAIGYVGQSSHTLTLRQQFPDGGSFASADTFGLDSLAAGAVLHLAPRRRVDLRLKALLTYSSYDDVLIESAGPPFDRVEPLDIAIDERFGLGLFAAADLPLGGGRWSVSAQVGVLAQPFEGDIRNDPDDPEPGSDIGLDFNGLVVGIGLGYSL